MPMGRPTELQGKTGCWEWRADLSDEEGVVAIGDFEALQVAVPGRHQLGEHFKLQGQGCAPHVEMNHDAAMVGLGWDHVDVQQLESCTRDVLQYGKTLLVAQKQWLANRHYYV